MKLSAKTLRMTAATVLIVSFLVYAGAATVGLIVRHSFDAAGLALSVMAWCVVAWMFGGALLALAWVLQWREDQPRCRFKRAPKPPGWNRSVLYWFHNGPERRVKGPEFSEGFRERAALGNFCLRCNAATGSYDELYCERHRP